jgi:hypothetical protein
VLCLLYVFKRSYLKHIRGLALSLYFLLNAAINFTTYPFLFILWSDIIAGRHRDNMGRVKKLFPSAHLFCNL